MNRFVTGLTGLAIVAGLSACGGGGNDDAQLSIDGAQLSIDPRQANELIPDATRPETAEGVRELEGRAIRRANGIGIESDFVGFTSVQVESTGDGFARSSASCLELKCMIVDTDNPERKVEFDLTDIDDVRELVEDYQYVLTKSDIDLFEGARGVFGPDSRLYGAWLNNSAFAVITRATGEVNDEDITITASSQLAIGGEFTSTQLTEDATWVGVMVGTPATGDQRDEILQGDVELNYTMSEQHIDAVFENIKNLDRNAAHSVERFTFDDVDVIENTYVQVNTNDGSNIVGGFYGDEHMETAGTFVKEGIVGAFGAKKQKQQ